MVSTEKSCCPYSSDTFRWRIIAWAKSESGTRDSSFAVSLKISSNWEGLIIYSSVLQGHNRFMRERISNITDEIIFCGINPSLSDRSTLMQWSTRDTSTNTSILWLIQWIPFIHTTQRRSNFPDNLSTGTVSTDFALLLTWNRAKRRINTWRKRTVKNLCRLVHCRYQPQDGAFFISAGRSSEINFGKKRSSSERLWEDCKTSASMTWQNSNAVRNPFSMCGSRFSDWKRLFNCENVMIPVLLATSLWTRLILAGAKRTPTTSRRSLILSMIIQLE